MQFSSKHIIASLFTLAVVVPLSLAYDLPVRIGDFVGLSGQTIYPIEDGFLFHDAEGQTGALRIGNKHCPANPQAGFCFDAAPEGNVSRLNNPKFVRKSSYSVEKDDLKIRFSDDPGNPIQIDLGSNAVLGGPTVQYNNQDSKNGFSFSADGSKPVPETNASDAKEPTRTIVLRHENKGGNLGRGFLARLLSSDSDLFRMGVIKESDEVAYESRDGRKADLYRFEETKGLKKLKNYTLYQWGDGSEEETYSFENAVLHQRDDGSIEGYYVDALDLSENPQAKGASSNLLDRASRFLAKERARDLYENGGPNPDFTIPAPMAIDRAGKSVDASFKILGETFNQLTVSLSGSPSVYPLVLDPTLQFNVSYPSAQRADLLLSGQATSNYFGGALVIANLDSDSDLDLAVGAYGYNVSQGRVYIFYNDGSYPVAPASADVIISGEATNDYFGIALATGDVNSDGRSDLVVGSLGGGASGGFYLFHNDGAYPSSATGADAIIYGDASTGWGSTISVAVGDLDGDTDADLALGGGAYLGNQGRTHLFYQDGSWGTVACTIDCLAANADVIITGEAGSGQFGAVTAIGNIDGDSDTDLIVSARNASLVYVFYNDGSYTTDATTADVEIVGEASSSFGYSLAFGDLDSDGDSDLAVGGPGYNTTTGRVYLLYNDGTIPTTAASADVILNGESINNNFGCALAIGNIGGDNGNDLAIGAYRYPSNSYIGRTYLFYRPPTGFSASILAKDANAIITGDATTSNNGFGTSLAIGNLDSDTDADLVVTTPGYSTNTGRVYIFYNDGSYPSGIGSTVAIDGDTPNTNFGDTVAVGDLNNDGSDDLVVGSYGYSTQTGRVYLFYSDGSIPNFLSSADVIITGEATSNNFGFTIAIGNLDGDTDNDLAVGAFGYGSSTGRAYLFYNDGSYPTAASSADLIISGSASSAFGSSIAIGNLDGDTDNDLAVGAYNCSSNAGCAYVFYNDGSYPTTAASADLTFTGEATSSFGYNLAIGNLDSDTDNDLAVGAYAYNSNQGRVYLFYNDGSWPSTAATADVTITGETSSNFSRYALAIGNLDADSDSDLVVGAYGYSSNAGRAYVFYNDGSYTTSATSADSIITGEAGSSFGITLAIADLEGDGFNDLAVGAYGYSSTTGRVYIFDNRSYGPLATYADVIINGDSTSGFGKALAAGDLNRDGSTDLAVGASYFNNSSGRAYLIYGWPRYRGMIYGEQNADKFGYKMAIGNLNSDSSPDLVVSSETNAGYTGSIYLFYNDGSYPTSAANADATITGEGHFQYFGSALAIGDLNGDSRDDLAVGAYNYSGSDKASKGRTYLFYNDGSYASAAANADIIITGERGSSFGTSIAIGNLDGDSDKDLVIGGTGISKAYLFYQDATLWGTSSCTTGCDAVNADMIITGEATGNAFGNGLVIGDLGGPDSKTDLVIGAPSANSGGGKVYIFYNDGSYPSGAASADGMVNGTGSYYAGTLNLIADLDSDTDNDLIIFGGGRAHLLYQDGSWGTVSCTTNCSITNSDYIINSGFASVAVGDLDGDTDNDIAIGYPDYTPSFSGRTFVFYQDGVSWGTVACTTDCSVTNADILITNASGDQFGTSLAIGDLDGDGDADLAAGGVRANWFDGMAYIFYNDGTVNFGNTACTGSGQYTCLSSNADNLINAAHSEWYFGNTVTVGDLDGDHDDDIAVSANYAGLDNANQGIVYIFYNDGVYPTEAYNADVVIRGETSAACSFFGIASDIGDLNNDDREDLVVGCSTRAYLFYNDGTPHFGTTTCTGSAPYVCLASNADVIFTGLAMPDYYTYKSIAIGNLDGDSDNDLAIGSPNYSATLGKVGIYYNDGTWPTSTPDVTINGETASYFGTAIDIGDINGDGSTDLVVGAHGYSSNGGAVYLFNNDGAYPATAASADRRITYEASSSQFGTAVATGDLDSDGDSDLVVGAPYYSSQTGKVYIFWNDGSYPTSASSADSSFTGEAATSRLGTAFSINDFDGDGDLDLSSGAYELSNSTGKIYIMFNNGNGVYPTAVTSANMILSGTNASDFSYAYDTGMLDGDGSVDFAVGLPSINQNEGYLYLFLNNSECGNGFVASGETCDDGNGYSGDGCSSSCQIESGYGCAGSPSICSLSGSITTQGIISNTRPAFTVTPSDNGSSLSAPNNPGTTVTFTSTVKDVNGDPYYLAVCKTNYVKPGVDAMPQCCSDGTLTTCDTNFPSSSSYTWAISDSDGGTAGYQATNSDSAATATYSVVGTESQANAWYAFNCDKLTSGALCAPLNADGNQGSALGQITFSGVPVDGATLTLDTVTYEFDTNSSVSAGNVAVNVASSLNGSQAASALVAVDIGPNSYLFSRANIVWVRADAIGAAGNSIAMAEAGDTGNVLALSGANLTGGNDANASPFFVNHAPSLGTVKIGPQCDSTASIDPGNSRIATVTTDFASNFDNAVGAKIQSDGRILAVGRAYSGTTYDFALARYSADMILDASFGSGGKVTTPFGSSTDQAYGIVTQADGKIIAAGYATMTNADFALARYNTDGSLDTTFDTDGKVTTPVGSGGDYGYAVALQTDGKIVVAGQAFIASNDFAVARYNTDGSLDTTFDTDGMVTTPVGVSTDYAYGIALQTDGKIVVVGYDYNGSTFDFTLVRYTASGALDTTFDTDGIVSTPMGSGSANGISVAIQSDGDIIAAGQCIGSINNDFCLARYSSTGSLDTTFDTDGKVITDMSAGADVVGSVVLQPDGKIVAVGGATNATNDFAAARYNVDGSLNNLSGYACVQAGLNDADTAGTETVDLYVCSTNSFNGSACSATTLCNMNGVLAGSDAQCIIDNQVPIPTAHGSYNVYLFTKDSHGLQGSGTSTQTYSVTDVVPTLVSYTATDTPVLTAGGNDVVDFSAVVSDNNGDNDITAINGTFFDLNAVANTCTADHNNCYIDAICDLDVASGTDTNRQGTCQIPAVYFNANVSSNWEVHVNPTDGNGTLTTLANSDVNIIVPALAGVAVVETQIAYGTLYVGQTSSTGIPISVGNVGNQVIDVLLQGSDMTYSSYSIPRAQQKWNQVNGATFDWDTEGHPLHTIDPPSGAGDANTNGCANLDLVVRDVATATTDNENLYWKLRLPSTQATGVYTGQATIAITSPTSCTGTP